MLEFSPLCLIRLNKSDTLSSVLKLVDSIHLDIMDGKFVPNTAFNVHEINEFKCIVPKHVHIMSNNPIKYIDELNNVASISFHYEAGNCLETINRVTKKKIKVGLVVNPTTPIESIFEYIPLLDRVVIMAVEPGFSEQKYLPSTNSKLIQLRKFSSEIEIVIDGGMNEKTIKTVKELGANAFVICSVIVKSKNKRKKILELKSIWNEQYIK